MAGFLDAVLGEQPAPSDVLARLRALDPLAAEMIEPLLAFTLSPTMIAASEQRNVDPRHGARSRSTAGSCPDRRRRTSSSSLRGVLGDGDYELETIERSGGTRSPLGTPLWQAIADWVEQSEPGAKLAPLCCAGFTDSHWLREAFGTVAYGFFPMRTMDAELAARLIHSADERTHVDDLALGVDFLRHAARSLLG